MGKLFCSKCGSELDEDDLFCISCGAPVKKRKEKIDDDEEDKVEPKEEKKETEEIKKEDKEQIKEEKNNKEESKKCPNCGSKIDSFETECPYCGTEIKGIKVSSTIEEFTKGLNELNSIKMPEKKDSLLKKAIGRDFESESKRYERELDFEREKEEKIANYIINYPIPNSKEELIEFMILIVSNIDLKKSSNDTLQEAWIKKMEQVYKKANLTIKNEKDINRIKEMYNDIKEKKDKKKRQTVFWIVVGVYFYIVLAVSLACPLLILSICFALFAIGVNVWDYFEKNNRVKPIFNYPKLLFKILSFVAIGISVLFLILFIVTTTSNSDNTENNNIEEQVEKYKIDYKSAKEFEDALNDDKDVEGKIVKFEVLEYVPNSAAGINCHAGEHLNFISEEELDVEEGDTVIGKITSEPSSFFGSWIIKYEVLDIEKKVVKPVDKIEEFTNGYEKGDYTKYQSDKSDDYLDNKIYIKGVLTEIELLGGSTDKDLTRIIGYIKDEKGNMWASILNVTVFVSEDYYDSYINEEVYLRGVFSGNGSGNNTPIIGMDKMLKVKTKEEVTGLQNIIDSKSEDEVIMFVLPEEYIGVDYRVVEETMEELGFTNIKLEAKKTADENNKNGAVVDFTIDGKTYKRGDILNKKDEVLITYWEYSQDNVYEGVEYTKAYTYSYKSRTTSGKVYFMFSEKDNKVIQVRNGGLKSKYSDKSSQCHVFEGTYTGDINDKIDILTTTRLTATGKDDTKYSNEYTITIKDGNAYIGEKTKLEEYDPSGMITLVKNCRYHS